MKRSHTLTWRPIRRLLSALTIMVVPAFAHAQLRLPSINLPMTPGIGGIAVDRLGAAGERLVGANDVLNLRALRLDQAGALLRRHRDVLEADPRGEPVVRREILAWSPSPAALAVAAAAGLLVEREQEFDGAALRLVVLRVPAGADTAATLAQLRALDPAGVYDFNHIYTGSSAGALPAAPAAAGGGETGPPPQAGAPRVGLVDSGVDGAHAVFRGASIRRWGCGNVAHPSAHGTAVAALMVGRAARFSGVAPEASLYAADVYCDSATGGSAEKIAGALAWLAREKVAVINLSLVGPPNQTLERVVAAMVGGGHLLVAAVGNDGPAAPPLYPASYPGVVGVSAVDRQGRVLPEAARGPQVMFAAPGNNMVSAAPGAPPYRQVRGTSFAAPLVAAMLAGALARPDKALAASAVAALAKQAKGAGATVSNETGYGIVGAAYRVDPSSFR